MKLGFLDPIVAELSSLTALLDSAPDLSDFADLGLFGMFGFTVWRWLSARSDRTTADSWKMLDELVDDLQDRNKELSQATATLSESVKEKDREIALLKAKLTQFRNRDLSSATKTLADTNSELVIQLKELAQYGG